MNKTIIIDDESLARQVVTEYLQQFPEIEVVAECSDGFEALKAIQEHRPELICLDIQMPKLNGFELLELIEHKPEVIFTTAFDEYALVAFEKNAVDYLLKPFSQQRFDKAIQKYLSAAAKKEPASSTLQLLENFPKKHQDETHRIVVKNGSSILIMPIGEVLYLEAYDDYVKVFNKETFFLKKKTMSYYEEVLEPTQFVRIHRSFLLNVAYLTKIEPVDGSNMTAVLKNGARLPISRAGYARLKEILNL